MLETHCETRRAPGIEGQFVVGQHIGPFLIRRHGLQANTGDSLHTKELCRLDTAMAGEDPVLIVDQDRIGEAEGLDTLGDLADLLSGMGPRIRCPGPECLRSKHFDGKITHGCSLRNQFI